MPGPNFTMYWSNLELYEKCPQQFLWSRGWEGIDVGGGPGKRKPLPVQDSRHHSVMGTVIQKVIEDMYNDELWKHPKGLVDTLLTKLDREFNFEVERNYIDWKIATPRDEMLEICKNGVLGFMQTMKHNRLLGTYARAEVDLLGWIDKDNPVGGRADLIIRRDDVGVMILDGKNSKEKGKYTDPDQLRWYALCYFLAYNQFPDKLGFVYYRYPYNPETGDSGIDWVEFTREDVKGIALRAVEARKRMIKHEFAPTPSPSTCRLCNYETVCEARQLQKAANSRNRKKPDLIPVDSGFLDLDISQVLNTKKK